MSNKFEQLLDLLVNEETDKANELFHEIVVEKSREIYESLIAEEAEEDEEAEKEMEEDESVEEGFGDQETTHDIGGDPADGLVNDVEDHDAMGDADEFGDDDMGDEMGADGGEPATKDDISDLSDALEELKMEFQALLAGEKEEEEGNPDIHGGALDGLEADDEEGEEEFGDEEGEEADDEEETDETFMREYREVVGKPYGGGKVAGKSEEGSTNKTSVVSTAKGRPTTGATAGNIAQAATGADSKAGVGGFLKKGGDFVKGGTQNVGGTRASGYTTKSTGHGSEKKGGGESSVNDKQIIKHIGK